MSNYAILRVEKLKTAAAVQTAANHNLRAEGAAPNADPEKEKDNVYLGKMNPLAAIKKLHEKLNIKVRKNAVIANEYLLTASPEFFEGMSKKEIKDWRKDQYKFLKDKHGDGLISFTFHADESTPHCHAIVTPIYQNDKRTMEIIR